MTQSPRSKPARRPVPEKLTNLINLRHPLRCRLAELIPWSELLTPQNRELLAIIRDKKPQWIAKLAELTGRASPNLTRTLGKLEAVGFVRMKSVERRKVPTTVVRSLNIKIDPFSLNVA